MKFPMIAICLAIAGSPGVAAAQTDSSLDATLNFIRDQVTAQGAVSWTAKFTDSSNGHTWPEQLIAQITNFTPSPSDCSMRYHWKQTIDGQTMLDRDVGVHLALVTDVVLITGEEDVRRQVAAEHPTLSAAMTPAAWVLQVKTRENEVVFDFTDGDAADRVAKAIAHAAQLCGGLKPAAS